MANDDFDNYVDNAISFKQTNKQISNYRYMDQTWSVMIVQEYRCFFLNWYCNSFVKNELLTKYQIKPFRVFVAF